MQSVSTVVSALSARSAVGHQSASTVVNAISARSAVGQQICEHGRERSTCKECGGSQESASTVVSALNARSAVGHKSASTVVGALSARSAVGLQSVSTVVSDLGARSVKAHTCDPTSPQSKHPLLPASVHRRLANGGSLSPPASPPPRRSREEHLLQLPLQHRLVTRRTLRVPAPIPSEQLEPARVTRRVLTRRLERLARRVAAQHTPRRGVSHRELVASLLRRR